MSHRLGVYFAPGHNRPADLDYIARLQPPVVRILDPDVGQIAAVYQAAPNALIMLRFWWLDDGRSKSDPHGQLGQLAANPIETAYRHAAEWKRETDRLRNEAAPRGFAFPPANQLMVSGVNEPNEAADAGNPDEYHALEVKIAQYTATFLDACYGYGLRAAALCLGVGHPARQLADGTPDWSRYMSIQAALTRGNHVLDLHAYWYKTGPQDGFGWHFGRERHCPLNAPIIVGETGVDNGVDHERWNQEGGARGWRGNIDAPTYAGQLMWALGHLDPRVIAMLPFSTDVRSVDWGAFDTLDAHEAILAAIQTQPTPTTPETPAATPPHVIHLPTVVNGPTPPTAETPQPPQPQPDADLFARAYAFTRRWEGGWADNPADPGGATNKGVTFGTFTAWRKAQGMAEPTLDDLRAIRDDEVATIFRTWYWQASGADQLPWPLALVQFDTAILHGVGMAQRWFKDSDGDVMRYLALRLRSYTTMGHWNTFGAGWTRRVSDLMEATRLA